MKFFIILITKTKLNGNSQAVLIYIQWESIILLTALQNMSLLEADSE